MMEVAEEALVAANPVQVEVETPQKSEDDARFVPKGPRVNAKRIPGTEPIIEGKVAQDKVEITDAENLAVMRLENSFLKNTQQISILQKQNEEIQRNFPEYIKSLAAKHSVDLTTHLFDSVEGAFRKKP